jgi:hypothetical protein
MNKLKDQSSEPMYILSPNKIVIEFQIKDHQLTVAYNNIPN